MSNSKLDQIVKGAPSPSTPAPPPPQPLSPGASAAADVPVERSPNALSDTSLAPQIPPSQVYVNLLILEASLRAQYLALRDRRRQNTFFIFLLSSWVAGFSYLLFLRPREDGSGIGGSVYWVVEMAEKVALMGGMVTAILIWGTGQWDRGVRWPRRWLSIANRGLRTMNAKIVIIKGPWWRELLGQFVFLFPYTSLFCGPGTVIKYSDARTSKPTPEQPDLSVNDEDLLPGGDYIKLLLLPKPFSPDFRENWELYRLEFWEKENERRAKLRLAIKEKQKELHKQNGRWPFWGRCHASQSNEVNIARKRDSVPRESHSTNASRSSTPSTGDAEEKPTLTKNRRGSTTLTSGERRRNLKSVAPTDFGPEAIVPTIGRPA